MQCCSAVARPAGVSGRARVGRKTTSSSSSSSNAATAARRSTTTRASAASTNTTSESGVSERTRRLLQGIEKPAGEGKEQASGAGGGTTLKALERVDAVWSTIRNMKTGEEAGPAPPPFVVESKERMGVSACDFDVCVCGGTLGILVAAALQARGREDGKGDGGEGLPHSPQRNMYYGDSRLRSCTFCLYTHPPQVLKAILTERKASARV